MTSSRGLLILLALFGTIEQSEIEIDDRVAVKDAHSFEDLIFTFGREEVVSIWIDMPNAFPWRHCLQEYNGLIATLSCDHNSKDQRFLISPLASNDSNSRRFLWKTKDGKKCIVPGSINHEGASKQSVKLVDKKECEDGHWLWTEQGQFKWSQGCQKCVQSYKFNTPVQFQFCKDYAEDQNLELGTWVGEKLTPLDTGAWQQRQDTMRTQYMMAELPSLQQAVAEVDIDDRLHAYDKDDPSRRRRAAVFYLDKGDSGISHAIWWVYTWKFIGLDSPDQGFDLVMMTHPAEVAKLPKECVLIPDNFKIDYNSSGQCLYMPYLGISHRDKGFDPFMNSDECLYGPGSEFLSQYTLLLRVDLDTFPTPKFLDWWPTGVIVDKNYYTNHGLDSIKNAITSLACSAGIEHQGWFNLGNTLYGEARSVRNIAKITAALNKFGRAQMFGPGTMCRCSDCNKLPDQCQWGGGPYAGTMQLYLQEIAANKVLTQSMYDNLPSGLLDQGTASTRSVCSPALLHCYHNDERFSKFAFGMGSYKNVDMSGLDITMVRDYATFMALTPNNQGKGGDEAIKAFFTKVGGNTTESNDSIWKKFCQETNKETRKLHVEL